MGDGALPDAVGSVLDVERRAPESDLRFGDAVAVRDRDGVLSGRLSRRQLRAYLLGCHDMREYGIGRHPVLRLRPRQTWAAQVRLHNLQAPRIVPACGPRAQFRRRLARDESTPHLDVQPDGRDDWSGWLYLGVISATWSLGQRLRRHLPRRQRALQPAARGPCHLSVPGAFCLEASHMSRRGRTGTGRAAPVRGRQQHGSRIRRLPMAQAVSTNLPGPTTTEPTSMTPTRDLAASSWPNCGLRPRGHLRVR